MSVTLLEIMAAAHKRRASLAAEVAGYLVLSVADQVLGAPRRPTRRDIVLQRDGTLRVTAGAPSSEVEAEASLRELLLALLEQASSVTPALVRSGKRSAQNGIDTLIREIETALIPVNRSAAKRALSRLYRDVNRAREEGVSLDVEVGGRRALGPVASVLPPQVIEPVKSVELPDVLFASQLPAPVAPVPPAVVAVAEASLETAAPGMVEIPIDIVSPTPPPIEVDVELDIVTDELVFAPVPQVPDLELPAHIEPTPRPRNEPATVPQPAVRRSQSEAHVQRTPLLGTRLEPALVLTDADITDQVPSAEAPSATWDEPQEHTVALPQVAPAPEPAQMEALIAPELPPVEATPAANPCSDRTLLLPPVEVVARAPSPSPPPDMVEGELVLESLDDDDDAIPFELTTQTPPRMAPEESSFEEAPLALTQSGELAEVDSRWDDDGLQIELQEVLPDIDVNSLETLADLPPRPLPSGHAASRYAPRRSDVDELLSGFAVGAGKSDRDVCRDLKLLAGIDATSPPPTVSLSETPPPVALTMEEEQGAELHRDEAPRGNSRAVIGAAVVALVVAGVGFGSIPLHARASTEAAPVAAAPVAMAPPVRVGESRRELPCAAEVNVTDVPVPGTLELLAGPERKALRPTRVTASGQVFSGLPCREAVDVMLALPGRRWLRVPVSASELTPSDTEPSLVRHSVALGDGLARHR